ncbi:MAG: hypothetical protein UY48_C0005G0017 [Candidatus Gottesmanbacteria bacterium GW2011_GWB1_49_7]|uniref:Uncharacterized protein n=1 Tax=Candidatus Gottesmanbacteria bacterium GW2011_GWB1_49_7 TaxID=1618448 RepID=A0A0G1W2S1_9BACT|nr:MAG: hypothetical protein UY48_C0005G0017 [Candidatus Gottesmanbacteria bacterium GW2011_GWB1_49_7]
MSEKTFLMSTIVVLLISNSICLESEGWLVLLGILYPIMAIMMS